ncbi:alpha/beta fold hydrolase [Aquimarina hainanensis]|uniref:Alpha/beta fold hydrolase n=1 Tax=Aquimarina hainanensis TaxID=1578017 RepID=A0ABW5N4I1_9FLAO|nr:alpha/beta fold hydrolase [Aquimarina sp. TRL1]QKX06071.1 alpha/beta fold hydrolase [Aquimarina sp. TRL1]
MIEEQSIIIIAEDGYELSAILRVPTRDRKGIVQIHSGTGIPQQLYANFASYLTEKGYATLTFDYRGIAESAPASLKGFKATIRDWGMLDMTAVFNWVLTHFPEDKKIIVAHSMGGQMIGLMKNCDQIDQLVLIASSTGYWKDMDSPYKWLPAFFWYIMIPVHTKIFGYVNARKVKQGENLPRGVALEWRKWCTNPTYFEDDFRDTNQSLFFDKIKIPLLSIQVADDPLANQTTATKLLKYYKNAQIQIQRIIPAEMGVQKIGHTGYFSRKFKDNLWKKLVTEL